MKKFLPVFFIATCFLFMSINIVANPMSGNYTINSALATGGSNFQSFNDFADSIYLNGVSGNVIATVAPGSGPYNEQVVFHTIPGAGPNATVMLDGSYETITAITDSANRHVIRLADIQYFTITNLHIVMNPLSTKAFYGVHILNTGTHITISNCNVDLTGNTNTLYGAFIASGSETDILTAGDFHFITITNDTATGGGYGASFFGLSFNLSSDIVISNNVFYDFSSNGIYLRETYGTIVSGNYFDKRTSTVTSVNAIQVAQAANLNAEIFNNFIKVSQTSNGSQTFRGIYLFNGTGHRVYNNVIYDVNLVSGNFTGIEIRTGGTAPEIYYNTISVDNPLASTGDIIGISEQLSNTNSIIKNNLISLSQPTSGMKAGISLGAISNVTTAINSNFNLIWVPNGNTAIKGSLTPVLYPTLSDWQTVSLQDSNSVSGDPGFISLTNPIPTTSFADNTGTPIATVTTDVVGNIRSITPDIGAYEFANVGMKETISKNNFQLSPNPARSFLNIEIPESHSKHVSIWIFNSCGQLELKKEIELAKDHSGFYLNTENLSQGLYLINVISGNDIYQSKFVKQ